ncbi:MAG: hypothetical protein MUC31_01890 [Bacteroidales bacterium]|jgi:hypothetical protein|nr:hypothetical protein [Bacteroidales bacterium]
MNTKYLRKFDKYHDGEMEPEEKAAFELSLSQDPELNNSYKEYISILDALRDRDALDLRIKLKEIRDETTRNKQGNDFFRHSYNWLWMAALLTIIISFTVIISLMITKTESTEQVAYEFEAVDMKEYSALNRELMKFEQRNMDFNLESPVGAIFFNSKEPLVFKWTVDTTASLILEMIDWEGRIVYSSGRYAESPHKIKRKLPGGILVYRFRTETESACIGFLFLK